LSAVAGSWHYRHRRAAHRAHCQSHQHSTRSGFGAGGGVSGGSMNAATSPGPGVTCRAVTKDYGSGGALVHALRGVELAIAPGELTLLVGPSGCGKTTLISIIAGTLDATSGDVSVLGKNLKQLSKPEKTHFRARNVGFVFQQFNLLPSLTAAEN